MSAGLKAGVKGQRQEERIFETSCQEALNQMSETTATSTMRSEIHRVIAKPPMPLPPSCRRLFNQPHAASGKCDEAVRSYRIADEYLLIGNRGKSVPGKPGEIGLNPIALKPEDRARRRDDSLTNRRMGLERGSKNIQIDLAELEQEGAIRRSRQEGRNQSRRREDSGSQHSDRTARPRAHREVSPESEASLDEDPNWAVDFPPLEDSRRVVQISEADRAAAIAHPELKGLSVTLDRSECDDARGGTMTTRKNKGKGKGASQPSAPALIVEGKGMLPGSHPANIAGAMGPPPPIPSYPTASTATAAIAAPTATTAEVPLVRETLAEIVSRGRRTRKEATPEVNPQGADLGVSLSPAVTSLPPLRTTTPVPSGSAMTAATQRPLPPIAATPRDPVLATVRGTGWQLPETPGARVLMTAWELAEQMNRPDLNRDRFFLAIREARASTPPGVLPTEESVRRVLWSLPLPWGDQAFAGFPLFFNEAPVEDLMIHVRQVALPIMEVLQNFRRAVTGQARRGNRDLGDLVKEIFRNDDLD